ncbi:MAG: hypothetical protein ACRDJO_13495 [Actinomycetota bacterium]
MKRLLVVVTLVAAACSGGGRDPSPEAAPSPGPSPTSASSPAAETPLPVAPSAALVGADAVAGLQLGATKAEAVAVLGAPTSEPTGTDVGGSTFESLRWDFDDDGGLVLNFRTGSGPSARLTDWAATAPGPHTDLGVEVQDPAAEVEARYGALEPFCCEATVASVASGGGRLIVVVDDGSKRVTQIIGGDEGYWSRSIAD